MRPRETSIVPRLIRLLAGVAVMTVCGTAAAFAQDTGSTRPYRALFGGSTANPDVKHSFDVTATVMGAYDDNVLADLGGGLVSPGSPVQESGAYTEYVATLGYDWSSRRVHVGANVVMNGRYYPEESQLIGVAHSAGVGLSAVLARRTSLYVNQSVNYSAAFMYGLFPELGADDVGEVVGVGPPLSDQQVLIYDTAVSLNQSLTRRASLEFIANTRYSDFGDSDAVLQDLRSYEMGGRYRHGLTRYTALRLGYIYRKGAYGFTRVDGPQVVHDIDIGIDYARALSFSRRTTVAFGMGSSAVNQPTDVASEAELQFRFVGNVNLVHEMGRTWRAEAAYGRGVGFAETFAQPVYSDSFNASLTGFFNRRTDFEADVAMAIGDVGLRESLSSFRLFTTSTRVRYALGKMWAIFGEYQYYSQDMGSAVVVPNGVPSKIDRHTVRTGLTLWVPIVRK